MHDETKTPRSGRGQKPGFRHSDDAKARIGASNKAHWSSPEKRAETSARTKQLMADPAVRQRIRAGMLRASGQTSEVRLLRAAWRAACPAVRTRFLAELFSPVCSASASEPVDRDKSE
jgi:hypothetical protein